MQPIQVPPQLYKIIHQNVQNTLTHPNQRLEQWFSRLVQGSYKIRSHVDAEYNCIAWAAGITDVPWWPYPPGTHPKYPNDWPDGAPRERTLPAFIRAFEILGYEPCQAHARERSYDKVAIYSKPVEGPTHAARLLRNGRWSSKIGVWELIEHDYEALTGHGPNEYGDIVQVMRRRKTLSRIVRDALLNRLDIIANFLEKQPP